MYILKNSIANIFRNKGRNLLLGILLFAVIFIASAAVIIQHTTDGIVHDYKDRFGSEVSLIRNPNDEEGRTAQPLSPQMLLSFGESSLLKEQQYIASVAYIPVDMKALDDYDQTAEINGVLVPKGTLYGYSRKDISDAFQNGSRKIIEGAMYANTNEVLVSKKFAEINALKVGDVITIQGTDKQDAMEQQLTISGIYEDYSMHASGLGGTAFTNRNNDILASLETVSATDMFQSYGYLDARLYLKDPAQLEELKQELSNKGLPSYYIVDTDEEGYKQIVQPVETIAAISAKVKAGVLLLGSIVLILLSVLGIRERKYEIGVLRAMGMKKSRVARGLLYESLIITLFCLIIGLGSAAAASKPIANVLLKSQISAAETNRYENTDVSSMDEIDTHLNLQAALQIAGIALLLAGVSSIAGIVVITKSEPSKILSERN